MVSSIERFYCTIWFLLPPFFVLLVTAGEVFERSYLGNVTGMQLNGFYAAALFEGKIQLHQVCA